MVYHPNPKGLESVTICGCHRKESTFSLVEYPEGWSSLELEPSASGRVVCCSTT